MGKRWEQLRLEDTAVVVAYSAMTDAERSVFRNQLVLTVYETRNPLRRALLQWANWYTIWYLEQRMRRENGRAGYQ